MSTDVYIDTYEDPEREVLAGSAFRIGHLSLLIDSVGIGAPEVVDFLRILEQIAPSIQLNNIWLIADAITLAHKFWENHKYHDTVSYGGKTDIASYEQIATRLIDKKAKNELYWKVRVD